MRRPMEININGRPTEVPEGVDLAALVKQLKLGNRRLAVEVNEELVPRSRFAEHRLKPSDRVEIIHAVGGG
jgi:sulfur carrier protein